MNRKYILPVLLVVVASLSVWLTDSTRKSPLPKVSSRADFSADGYMQNFTTTIMNAQGLPVYELSAQSMAHYPYDDHSEFRAPLMTLYRDNGYRWTVVSDTARAEQGTEKILLQGEVVMHRVAAGATAIDLEILTRDLLVLPDEDYAETDQHTVITRGESVLQAEGARAYFGENRVQLLSEVRGVYEPRP